MAIAKGKLKIGRHYFFVTYEDRDLRVPVIETLRFRSAPRNGDAASDLFLFDRVGDGEPRQCRLPEDLLETVFEFDDLVAELDANREAQRAGRPFQGRPQEEQE